MGVACGDQVVVRESPSTCGNGQVEPGEACDDGNTIATDDCTADCQVARCGDAVTREGNDPQAAQFEACDDGNSVDHDACRNNCQLARCGDGIVRSDLADSELGFEACDDGNADDDDNAMACELKTGIAKI